MTMAAIGVMGLAVMGQNLAMNIADKGFEVSVYNRTTSKMTETVERAKAEKLDKLKGYETVEEFIQSLALPRKVIIMVKAGAGVEMTIEKIRPLLSKGDIVIDGGNEFFEITQRRLEEHKKHGIEYLGMGISGGEEGARYGPSLMPGGSKAAYDACEAIFRGISAKSFEKLDCVTYVGSDGAGHFVKMVHNGIEYADMECIVETYQIMREMGISNAKQADIFEEWNKGRLESYLIEITARILKKADEKDANKNIVDYIKDIAGSKGTGMWTIQQAASHGVPTPSIEAAFMMRAASGLTEVRQKMREVYGGVEKKNTLSATEIDEMIKSLEHALWCSKVVAYAQGFMLLTMASSRYSWNLDMSAIATIWQGGCIIRAQMLVDILSAFQKDKKIHNLLLSDVFSPRVKAAMPHVHKVIIHAITQNIPVPAFTSGLQYFNTLTAHQLPTNLIQAQRDFFGAHTYERTDQAGTFHTQW